MHVSHLTHCFEEVFDACDVTDARFGSSIDLETRIKPGAQSTSPWPGSSQLEWRSQFAVLLVLPQLLLALLLSFSAFLPLDS